MQLQMAVYWSNKKTWKTRKHQDSMAEQEYIDWTGEVLDITRHHAYLSLCGKSRKNNNAKSRKWKNLNLGIFLMISTSNISKLQIFLKNRFHSNWRSYLVPTSGQKPKKSLEPFLKKISVSDFGLIWRPFREYLHIKNFFRKPGSATFLPL